MKPRALLPVLLLVTLSACASRPESSPGKLVCVNLPPSNHAVCAVEFNPEAQQTVVLIHGLHGDPIKNWEKQISYFSRDYHILSLQLSSFYRASAANGEEGVSALIQALHLLTQRHAKGPIKLFAHSMGGVIGLRYALEYPDMVNKLVLVDVAGVLQRISYTRSLIKNRRRAEGEGELFTRLLDKLVTKILIGMDGYTAEMGTQIQQLEDEGYYVRKPELEAAFHLIDEDFSHSIATVEIPVLIVWGENDRIAPLRTGYALAARLPVTQLLIIPQTGHLPMLEKPRVFNRAVASFLARSPALQRPGVSYPVGEVPLENEVECRGENGREFSGYYRRILLTDCSGVVIRNARVREVVAVGSRLTITHSKLGGGTFGLSATGSEVEITASRIEGEVALLTSRSRIDMAAVSLFGHKAAVEGKRESDLLFSLSTLHSPHRQGAIHGYFMVDSAHSL